MLGKGGTDCLIELHPWIVELAAHYTRKGYWFPARGQRGTWPHARSAPSRRGCSRAWGSRARSTDAATGSARPSCGAAAATSGLLRSSSARVAGLDGGLHPDRRHGALSGRAGAARLTSTNEPLQVPSQATVSGSVLRASDEGESGYLAKPQAESVGKCRRTQPGFESFARNGLASPSRQPPWIPAYPPPRPCRAALAPPNVGNPPTVSGSGRSVAESLFSVPPSQGTTP